MLKSQIFFRYKPEALPRISQESGVNVIVGTSFYVDPFIPEDVKLLSVEEVRSKFMLYSRSIVYKIEDFFLGHTNKIFCFSSYRILQST